MGEEETISEEAAEAYWKYDEYKVFELEESANLKMCMHNIVNHGSIQLNFAAREEIKKGYEDLKLLSEAFTNQQLLDKSMEWRRFDSRFHEVSSARDITKEEYRKFAAEIYDFFSHILHEGAFAEYAREHIEEAYQVLELGSKEDLIARAEKEKQQREEMLRVRGSGERADSHLKTTGDAGYIDMDRKQRKNELGG